MGPANLSGANDTTKLPLASLLVASDSARQGLLILGPGSMDGGDNPASSLLLHVSLLCHESKKELRVCQQLVDAKFDQVQCIADDGTNNNQGALLHYRKFKDLGWKLMRAALSSLQENGPPEPVALVEQYKCPKNAKIASTGQGAVWVLKKTGRGLNWGLQYLHPTETVEESIEKYGVNSILGGAVVGTTSTT